MPLIISFASFPDETALEADYVFPDHTPLESWGYQRIWAGADRPLDFRWPAGGLALPRYARHAPMCSWRQRRAWRRRSAAALPYPDEVAFIQEQIKGLMEADGFYKATTPETFWAQWQQYGGWWAAQRRCRIGSRARA